MSLEELLDLAEKAARAAGRHARSQIGLIKPELKPPDQIVTAADRQCQALIMDMVKTHYPNHGYIAEEGDHGQLYKAPPTDPQQTWWVIDPIDGTTNYAHGIPHFAVSIGVMRDGYPLAGVIYDPNTDLMFTAQRDSPAFCNGRTIHCLDEPLHPNSQFAIPGRYRKGMPPWVAKLMEKYVGINLGTAVVHYAYVAKGAYSAAISRDVKLWDIAAGSVIAQSAGATITDFSGKPLFPLDCLNYQGEAIPLIMAHPTLHQQLLQMVASANAR